MQEGSIAVFKCMNDNHVKWEFNDNADRNGHCMFLKNILLIKYVQLKHYGYYNCSGVDEISGLQFHDTTVLKVIGIDSILT